MTKSLKHDGFKRGQSTFTCIVCKKLTRETWQNTGLELCPACTKDGEHENSHLDGQFPNDDCGDKNCKFKR